MRRLHTIDDVIGIIEVYNRDLDLCRLNCDSLTIRLYSIKLERIMHMIWMILFSCGNAEKEDETEISTYEQVCIEECQDFHTFWEACFEEITNQGFFIDCYQEMTVSKPHLQKQVKVQLD